MTTKEQTIAEYRRRYGVLKASGQTPKALPELSMRPAAAIDVETVVARETIPGGWYWTTKLSAGETLRIALDVGQSAVSLLAWNRHDPSERLNTADTVKVQWTAALRKGRVVFSDMGKVMLSIVEDSCAAHDALMGGSTAMSTLRRYGQGFRNTRDNFLLAAAKLGLGARDIPPCMTFFAPVHTDADGVFVWEANKRKIGDFVDLRAEMDLLVALSNCPHPLDPAPDYAPAPVAITRFRGSPPAAEDLCRTATDEARRGFENNAAAA